MIFGLKIDIPAEQLVEPLAGRAQDHESKAKEYAVRRRTLGDRTGVDDESTDASLARVEREHAERAQALKFLSEHVVAGEVYRLDESDLRRIELIPSEFTRWLLA
jgi:hypothetical protein